MPIEPATVKHSIALSSAKIDAMLSDDSFSVCALMTDLVFNTEAVLAKSQVTRLVDVVVRQTSPKSDIDFNLKHIASAEHLPLSGKTRRNLVKAIPDTLVKCRHQEMEQDDWEAIILSVDLFSVRAAWVAVLARIHLDSIPFNQENTAHLMALMDLDHVLPVPGQRCTPGGLLTEWFMKELLKLADTQRDSAILPQITLSGPSVEYWRAIVSPKVTRCNDREKMRALLRHALVEIRTQELSTGSAQ